MSVSSSAGDAAVIIRQAAMNMLARREHSFHELQQKLAGKFPDIPDDLIRQALERLQQEKLQSDERFLESFVRHRSSRGMGPLKIAAELYPKKVDENLLNQALDAVGDWNELCLQVLQKKFLVAGKPSMQDQARWSRFLQQRGFSSDQIRHALRESHDSSSDS